MSIQIQRQKRRSLHRKHKERRKDIRPFMPMTTAYMADPALRFKCNETRGFSLVPNAIDYIASRWYAYRGHHSLTERPYSRLEYYGVKQGYVYDVKGVTDQTHFMTERALGIAYFKNSPNL